METLTAEILDRLATDNFNAQQLSNLLWALTILRLCTPEVCRSCARASFEDGALSVMQSHRCNALLLS